MKNPLKRFTIAVTGDFGPQRSHEKIRQWVEFNGGTFAVKISPDVTHLICSRDHLKKAVAMVRQARKIEGLYIVSFDWLEDSLMKSWPRKEANYILKRQVQATKRAKKERKAVKEENIRKGLESFEKGCKEFETHMFSTGYHVYQDTTGFSYDITLARANLVTNKNERYHLKVGFPLRTPLFPSLRRRSRVPLTNPRAQRLQIYESHTEPVSYATFVRYSAPGATTKEILAPVGSPFTTAFGAFKLFFRIKTKREWDARLDRGPLLTVSEDTHGLFVYSPPAEGEPKGLLLEL